MTNVPVSKRIYSFNVVRLTHTSLTTPVVAASVNLTTVKKLICLHV